MKETPHVSSERDFYMPPLPLDKKEKYQNQMVAMFGSCIVPPVIYKGVTYPRRFI